MGPWPMIFWIPLPDRLPKSELLREEKSKVRTLGVGLEEESKRSLAMEAELERHLVQINSQAEELQASRISNKVSFKLCLAVFFANKQRAKKNLLRKIVLQKNK